MNEEEEQNQIDKLNRNLASQHDELIEATYKMSIKAKRVFLMLLGEINPAIQYPEKMEKITIHAHEYADKTGISYKSAYRDMREGAKELIQTIIEMPGKQKNTVVVSGVITDFIYHTAEGWFELNFSEPIKKYVLDIIKTKKYTTIMLHEALTFRRFYTIRFFELLMQQDKNKDGAGNLYTTVTKLRVIFKISDDKYKEFKDFRIKVLQPSIAEIEKETSIRFKSFKAGKFTHKFKATKKVRKVEGLTFSFYRDPQMDMFKNQEQIESDKEEDIKAEKLEMIYKFLDGIGENEREEIYTDFHEYILKTKCDKVSANIFSMNNDPKEKIIKDYLIDFLKNKKYLH